MHSVGQALQDYDRYEGLTDEELVALAQDHDDQGAVDYLVEKYKNFVRARARSYFLMGADRDDIIQEGMIGLYKATRYYKTGHSVSFKAFAEMCITRQIISAVKAANVAKAYSLELVRFAQQADVRGRVRTNTAGCIVRTTGQRSGGFVHQSRRIHRY